MEFGFTVKGGLYADVRRHESTDDLVEPSGSLEWAEPYSENGETAHEVPTQMARGAPRFCHRRFGRERGMAMERTDLRRSPTSEPLVGHGDHPTPRNRARFVPAEVHFFCGCENRDR